MIDLSNAKEQTENISETSLLESVENGSALVAVVGLDSFLSDSKLKITNTDINMASSLQKDLEKRVSEFLSTDKFRKVELGLKRSDFVQLREKVISFSVDKLADKISVIDSEELKSNVTMIVSEIVSELNLKIPVVVSRYKDSFPSDYYVSEFIRSFRTLSNPLSIFDELEMGCLTSNQVELVKKFYPTIYELIKYTIMEGVVDRVSDKDYVVPYKKLKQISVLLQQPVVSEDLSKLLEFNFKQESEEKVQVKSKGDFSNIVATESQKKELRGK